GIQYCFFGKWHACRAVHSHPGLHNPVPKRMGTWPYPDSECVSRPWGEGAQWVRGDGLWMGRECDERCGGVGPGQRCFRGCIRPWNLTLRGRHGAPGTGRSSQIFDRSLAASTATLCNVRQLSALLVPGGSIECDLWFCAAPEHCIPTNQHLSQEHVFVS